MALVVKGSGGGCGYVVSAMVWWSRVLLLGVKFDMID